MQVINQSYSQAGDGSQHAITSTHCKNKTKRTNQDKSILLQQLHQINKPKCVTQEDKKEQNILQVNSVKIHNHCYNNLFFIISFLLVIHYGKFHINSQHILIINIIKQVICQNKVYSTRCWWDIILGVQIHRMFQKVKQTKKYLRHLQQTIQNITKFRLKQKSFASLKYFLNKVAHIQQTVVTNHILPHQQ
eukprot:TRINITY_DN5735_c0_g1_i7.p2 TRINITY_DN5735_c0_g1~~TRINITY_DN5735_c0_g1_i7.p2  ORF type:complete len:210 (+),score=-14.69 TRINITY_DN5735_c0_g1_i7:60-632(+)